MVMKKRLLSKLIIITIISLFVLFLIWLILSMPTSYTYEDIENTIQVTTAPNNDVCIEASLPDKDIGSNIMIWKTLGVDELNKIKYYSAVICMSSTISAKYFGKYIKRPICLISENGTQIDTTFFDGQYNENGMPIPIDRTSLSDDKYKQCITEIYYAQLDNDFSRSFKSTPKLIWSRDNT